MSLLAGLSLDIASKCQITDPRVLRKCKELLLFLESKGQCIKYPESCKIIACLNIASLLTTGIGITMKDAVKYTGVPQGVLSQMCHNIGKILYANKVVTVDGLCFLLGVYEIRHFANKIMAAYGKTVHMDHPKYRCAAVLTAARLKKVTIPIRKLLEMSRASKSQLEHLVFDMCISYRIAAREEALTCALKRFLNEHERAPKRMKVEEKKEEEDDDDD